MKKWKGLLNYYYFYYRYKFVTVFLSIICVSFVGIIEDAHDLVGIYILTSFILLPIFETEKERKNNFIIEKIIPISDIKVFFIKATILSIFEIVGVIFLISYILIVKNIGQSVIEVKKICEFAILIIPITLNAGILKIYSSSLVEEKRNKFVYVVPLIQILLLFGCKQFGYFIQCVNIIITFIVISFCVVRIRNIQII